MEYPQILLQAALVSSGEVFAQSDVLLVPQSRMNRYPQTPSHAIRPKGRAIPGNLIPQYFFSLPAPEGGSWLLRLHLVPVLLILDLPPVPRRLARAAGLAPGLAEGALARVQLVALPGGVALLDVLEGGGLVAAEALAHVDHAAAALPEALLELLALGGQRLGERGPEALGGRVALDQDALGLLEALRQGGSCWEGDMMLVRLAGSGGPGFVGHGRERGLGRAEGQAHLFLYMSWACRLGN